MALNYNINFLGLCGFVAMFNAILIFPIPFNYFIIPGIEKKIGRKLEYNKITYSLYGEYMRYGEISYYMIAKLLIKLIGKDPSKLRVFPKSYALQKVNYPYEMFSRK